MTLTIEDSTKTLVHAAHIEGDTLFWELLPDDPLRHHIVREMGLGNAPLGKISFTKEEDAPWVIQSTKDNSGYPDKSG